MLQNLRENLRGTVAFIVIAVIVGAMVLIGVDSLFVSSVAGNNVAKVNGEEISRRELQRAIEMRKLQMAQQFQLEPGDERLSDENLREPTLTSLIQQRAIIQAAREGGMAVADETIKKQIVEGFSRDGEFDRDFMNNYLNRFGYTPTTFAKNEENNYIMRQLAQGVMNSAFLTEKDIALFASIVGQKRSFFALTLSKSELEKSIEVTDTQIEEYYNANQDSYREEEKVIVDYLEVSADYFAQKENVDEQLIRDEYEKEISDFEATTDYEIAHILVEQKDSDEATAKIVAEVQSKLDAGDDFAELAKQYSDDLGSKNVGGSLGKLQAGVFPSEFEDAIYQLEQGKVSAPVKTDSGTHFIKLISKNEVLPPSYEERKESIASVLKQAMGSEKYLQAVEDLDRLTFGAENLEAAAKELGLSVQSTAAFGRNGGSGVAANKDVYTEAYGKDVFEEKRNSKLIELPGEKTVVLRLKEHQESFVKPLADVKASISTQLKNKAIQDGLMAQAKDISDKLKAGTAANELAVEGKVSFSEHKLLDRTAVEANRMVLNKAFTMARPSEAVSPVLETTPLPNGDVAIVGLTEVQDGAPDSMESAQVTAMTAQLKQQIGMDDYSAFERKITSSARYSVK